mmetsp:Transcript_113011/g.364891  ORF Transcript_113011/g.364891 Transcript_113011/m.364891 type:complete len:603 (-) Transcript_113011:198-2006(-)
MGYFVQITNDVGSPLFQVVRNYPDVSFASSALFHALVTASLEQGFVPSVLRAQDATIALAIHGPAGSRLCIALVTSEFAAGQTRDLEAQLHWRLSAVYRGALLVAGGELLRRQPSEPLRRLLGQRLSPIVASVMADESGQGICGRVPRIGLAVCGAAVEWLARSPAADAALERIVACLPSPSGVATGGARPSGAAAALSWQGRALAVTPAWRRLNPVDRALLLALAEEVGPATFERPSRSWGLEELDNLWLPSTGAGSVHATGTCNASEASALRPLGVRVALPAFSESAACRRAQRYHMVSIRLYPVAAAGDIGLLSRTPCNSCCESAPQREPRQAEGSGVAALGAAPQSASMLAPWDAQPELAEVASLQCEESALVLSFLECDDVAGEGGTARAAVSAAGLHASVELCGDGLRDLWRCLHGSGAGENLLQCTSGHLIAVVLLNELSQDVITIPPALQLCTALPWQCRGRQRKAAAVRRLLYWIHALPQLCPQRPQHYACCESYAVGAVRREDGLQCWGIMDLDLDPEWQGGPLGEERPQVGEVAPVPDVLDGNNGAPDVAPDTARGARVLRALGELVQQLPRSPDVWTIVGGLGSQAHQGG